MEQLQQNEPLGVSLDGKKHDDLQERLFRQKYPDLYEHLLDRLGDLEEWFDEAYDDGNNDDDLQDYINQVNEIQHLLGRNAVNLQEWKQDAESDRADNAPDTEEEKCCMMGTDKTDPYHDEDCKHYKPKGDE